MKMRLRVSTPTAVVLDEHVDKVVAEGLGGSFCLLPRHRDWAAVLVPSLLTATAGDREHVVAVDGGVLVKHAGDVRVATPDAILSPSLEELEEAVGAAFAAAEERERLARAAVVNLEVDILRRLVELEVADGLA